MSDDNVLAAFMDGAGRGLIAVLAPHPDDESLGCGGLLARAFAGEGAIVICLTDGGASHPASREWPAERLAGLRREELEEAIRCLGGSADDLAWLGLPDSRLPEVDPAKVADEIALCIERRGARYVFAPAVEDHHADHKATAKIADILRTRNPALQFFTYPVWSRWDDPDFRRTIARHDPFAFATSGTRDKKRAAINAHHSQLGKVVSDDPDGFVMQPAFTEKFILEDEIFWRTP